MAFITKDEITDAVCRQIRKIMDTQNIVTANFQIKIDLSGDGCTYPAVDAQIETIAPFMEE